MTNLTSASHLEALPAELFNHTFSYIFNPHESEIKESITEFGGYRFETSLLRINKNIHQLAKSHLHHVLPWVRFSLNWGAFAIEPRWLGVNYINTYYVKATKSPPAEFLKLRLRPVPQQAPSGRLHIKIEFPHPSHEAQEEVMRMVKSGTNTSMSLLVLEEDLASFMQVLRMNDLAYCHRNFPGTLISSDIYASRGVHGIKSEIVVAPSQQSKRYQHLILEFHVMRDSLHKTAIVGHGDIQLVKKSMRYIQQQLNYSAQKNLGLPKTDMSGRLSWETMGEAISSLLWPKHRGDEYLTKGLYSNAYMCYSSACVLENNWLRIAPPPTEFNFWTIVGCLYVTFGMSLMYNMAIAKMAGGLDLGPINVRGTSIVGYYGMLAILSGGGRLLDHHRFVELNMVAMIYENLAEDVDDGYRSFDLIEEIWEEHYTTEDLPSGLGLLYKTVKRINHAGHTPTSHPESLQELKGAAARGFADTKPLKWAVTGSAFSKALGELVKFLPRVQLLPGGAVENSSGYRFEIPVFCEPTDEQRLHGENRLRYLV